MSPVCDVSGRLFFRDQTLDVLRFSDDEGLLAFGGWSGELSMGVMDVKKGAILWYVKGFGPSDLAFSLDRQRVYATNAGGSLGCFDSSSGEKVWNDVVRFPMGVPLLTTVQCTTVWEQLTCHRMEILLPRRLSTRTRSSSGMPRPASGWKAWAFQITP